MDDDNEKEITPKEPTCSRCGLRTYNDPCPNCGAPIVDKGDDEEEEYDWRERKK
jgi:hypothetical protein